MSTVSKKFKISMSFLIWILLIHNGHAALLIDDFNDFQYATNGVDGPMSITGTQLTHLTRTLTASASANQGAETEVVAEGGGLSISNNTDSSGVASIYYSFDLIDLTVVADALLFNIGFNDIGHEIQVLANNSAVYGFTSVSGVGSYLIEFSQFTNPWVFKQLTSLELRFQGEQAWDVLYGSFSASTTSVPEPSVLALLSMGLMLLSRANRRSYS